MAGDRLAGNNPNFCYSGCSSDLTWQGRHHDSYQGMAFRAEYSPKAFFLRGTAESFPSEVEGAAP